MLDTVVSYLDEMEVPKQIAESMVATGSAEIRWVDSWENGLRRPPSIAEWEDASCESFTHQEEKAMSELLGTSNRSQQESLLLKLLAEKATKKNLCERDLISSQRARLAPP